jgi:hypothetical protein
MAFAVDACSYPASEVVHWPLGYTMLISSRITRRVGAMVRLEGDSSRIG